MSIDESEKQSQEISLPKDNLRQWVEARYDNVEDQSVEQLKHAALKAIEEEDWEKLVDLAHSMDAQLTYLRGKFPEEWSNLDALHGRLVSWLESRN